MFSGIKNGCYVTRHDNSEQNLLCDETCEPVSHPQINEMFSGIKNGCYVTRHDNTH